MFAEPDRVEKFICASWASRTDHAKIVETFKASAADDQLGIPVRLDGDKIHITYRAAILVANRPAWPE
jgi:hypothetical protein